MDLWIMYRDTPRFKEYVDKYCKKHEITPEEAIRHEVVKSYAEQLEKNMKEKRETT